MLYIHVINNFMNKIEIKVIASYPYGGAEYIKLLSSVLYQKHNYVLTCFAYVCNLNENKIYVNNQRLAGKQLDLILQTIKSVEATF